MQDLTAADLSSLQFIKVELENCEFSARPVGDLEDCGCIAICSVVKYKNV